MCHGFFETDVTTKEDIYLGMSKISMDTSNILQLKFGIMNTIWSTLNSTFDAFFTSH